MPTLCPIENVDRAEPDFILLLVVDRLAAARRMGQVLEQLRRHGDRLQGDARLGQEGTILRFVFCHSLMLALLVMLQAIARWCSGSNRADRLPPLFMRPHDTIFNRSLSP